ncbi:TonB-dependent receptor domain-containing protein [Mangrovibacterium lignilyticum]|uniref:TonB-dependent receptor domain-containing protein n=1 Tax=Mangrovibacterium lignilyticum TaxID=2668052 RepID=UPI0013D3AEC2|nr:TonB-dependent receptor [Mangrovibacterium lignilyticum]
MPFQRKGLKYVLFLCVLLLLSSQSVWAQSVTFRLINPENGELIRQANFQYGKQAGNSGDNGIIQLEQDQSSSLFISHLQFGKQEFSPKEVALAAQTGELKINPQSHLLQPVVYFQIHPTAGEKESMNFQSAEMLEHDAGNLLDRFMAISSIRKSGSYGFDPVIRGFKYDQVNLVIDGVQGATAGCPNRMDPSSSQVPMNMINQVEIVKGPYSLRYGNAFGGTVNFKSAGLDFSEAGKLGGRLSSSYETNGNISRTEGLANYTNRFSDLKLFGAYATGDDYKDGDGMTVPASFNRRNLGGKLGIKLTDSQELSAMLANNYAENVDFPTLPMDLRKDDTWLFNLGHAAHFSKSNLTNWETSLYATKVNHTMDNYDKLINPRMVDAITFAKTQNFGGRTEMHFDFEKSYLFAGTDMRVEKAEGERQRTMLMGPMAGMTVYDNVWQDAQIRKNGVFAEYHLPGESYQLVFSGRLELNHAETQNPDAAFSDLYEGDLTSDLVNPAFSLGGTKILTNRFSAGLWLGLTQRSPGLAERYINYFPIGLDPYELVGNPNLKAETNKQIDLVLSWKSKQTNINLNAFSAFIGNYISSEIRDDLIPRMTSAPGVRQYINIDQALHAGFELSWKQQYGEHLYQIAELAYTYGKNKDSGEALPEIPPMEFRYRIVGSFIRQKLQAEISFRHSFKQDRIATSYGENETPAFNVVDLKANYLITSAISVNTGVNNLLDEAYYEHLSRNMTGSSRPLYSPGRSFYFSLVFNFL